MSKQKTARMERRAEGIVNGLELLRALRERAEGMHAREMCTMMGLRSGTARIGQRLNHIEDAVCTAGAGWEEVLIRSEDREPRWRAGPGIDTAMRAAEEYIEAIGPLAGKPLDDETFDKHSGAEPLHLTALQTVYDKEKKPLHGDIASIRERLETAEWTAKAVQWTSNPAITAVHAIPAGQGAAPLPEEITAGGRWCEHGANGTRGGEAGAIWTNVHNVEAPIAYTRRVYRALSSQRSARAAAAARAGAGQQRIPLGLAACAQKAPSDALWADAGSTQRLGTSNSGVAPAGSRGSPMVDGAVEGRARASTYEPRVVARQRAPDGRIASVARRVGRRRSA